MELMDSDSDHHYSQTQLCWIWWVFKSRFIEQLTSDEILLLKIWIKRTLPLSFAKLLRFKIPKLFESPLIFFAEASTVTFILILPLASALPAPVLLSPMMALPYMRPTVPLSKSKGPKLELSTVNSAIKVRLSEGEEELALVMENLGIETEERRMEGELRRRTMRAKIRTATLRKTKAEKM